MSTATIDLSVAFTLKGGNNTWALDLSDGRKAFAVVNPEHHTVLQVLNGMRSPESSPEVWSAVRTWASTTDLS